MTTQPETFTPHYVHTPWVGGPFAVAGVQRLVPDDHPDTTSPAAGVQQTGQVGDERVLELPRVFPFHSQ